MHLTGARFASGKAAVTGPPDYVNASQRGRGAAAATLVYELENEVAGNLASFGRIAGRSSDCGGTLTFTVTAPLRANPRLANPFLVVSNGGGCFIVYDLSAR